MTNEVDRRVPKTHNFQDGTLFTYGKTKSAVILRDMARALDEIIQGPGLHSNWASRLIGHELNAVIDVVNYVTAAYNMQKLNKKEWGGVNPSFKEQYIWHRIDTTKLVDYWPLPFIPDSTLEMFRTVAKEYINIRKSELGILPHKDLGYTPSDLHEWNNSELVQRARENWKTSVRKQLESILDQGYRWKEPQSNDS